MGNTETDVRIGGEPVDLYLAEDVIDEKQGTMADRADMMRLGKVQELRRNFNFLSIFGFSMILMASWEAVLSVAVLGLEDGGKAGLIWMYLICWIAFIFINTSMAEMGSMAPTTGGQYHWVSEFAPRQHQKFISYVMGWLCVLGWQTGCASTAYVTGTQIQGLVVLNYPTYVSEPWHGTLITIAIAAFSATFNIFFAKKLPLIESVVVVIHVCAFIGIIVTLWVLAPLSDSSVFTDFTDGGWNNLGVSTLAGITAAIAPLIGADAAVHMSEELKDAGKTLPRSMIWSTIVNGAFGWVMVITLCFCLGDLQDVLSSPTGYPYIQVFYNATQTTSGATAMAVWVILMVMLCNVTAIATASRQLYAFARDEAMPFSPWFAAIRWELPVNSIGVTFVTTSLLSLINLGSATALNSITSLQTSALLSSYICSIGCMIWRRLTKSRLPPSKFGLGRYGLAINITAELLLIIMFVLTFFPPIPDPDSVSMNWNIVIYGGVVLFSLVYYVLRGRHRYVGPVEYVRKLD